MKKNIFINFDKKKFFYLKIKNKNKIFLIKINKIYNNKYIYKILIFLGLC